jgi:hypothetical protein
MAEKQDKLVPLTVRFTGPAVETIRTVAKEHGLSLAEIIRFTMDNKLSEYLGSIQFVDYDQGKDIEKELHVLINMTQKVGQELNRIGVNYNQEIKLRHLQERYDAKKMTMDERLRWKQEYAEAQYGQSTLSKEELDELLTRYENVSKRVGELLKILNS